MIVKSIILLNIINIEQNKNETISITEYVIH